MKKLFISCPMNGRTKEQIQKSMTIAKKCAELKFDEEFEVIDSWIDEEPPKDVKNQRMWYIGKSIELLSQADCCVLVWIHGNQDELKERFHGCLVEQLIAKDYKIPNMLINIEFIAPDLFDDKGKVK